MAKGCELCKLSNMTDALRRAPGKPQAREVRFRLERMKRYETGVTGLCADHAGAHRTSSAQIIEHWVERVEHRMESAR